MNPKYLIIFLSLLAVAQAHWADLAAAEINLSDQTVVVNLTLPTGLVGKADSDQDGQLSAAELDQHRDWLEPYFARRIRLESQAERAQLDGVVALGAIQTNLSLEENSHSSLELRYRFEQPLQHLEFSYDLFLADVPTATLLLTFQQGERVQSFVLNPEETSIQLPLDRPALAQQIWGYLKLGVGHILTGYDHVLFLLTLLMLGSSLGQLLKIVTAFTLAHSVTLSLAVLDIVNLSPRLVESGIALSIAYVAIENLWLDPEKATRWRWILTFGFGLIHGLGFAGILQELTLTGRDLVVSLISFNVGVEIGQLVIVTVSFFLLQAIKRFPWELTLRRTISVGAAAMGLFWFVERAFML